MGHIALTNIKIEKPSKEVLRQAVGKVAEKIGAKVICSYFDFYGNKKEGFTLKNEGDDIGIGIIIENDKIKIERNLQPHSEKDMRRIRSSIEINYISVAVQEALRELGYIVQVEESDKEISITVEEDS